MIRTAKERRTIINKSTNKECKKIKHTLAKRIREILRSGRRGAKTFWRDVNFRCAFVHSYYIIKTYRPFLRIYVTILIYCCRINNWRCYFCCRRNVKKGQVEYCLYNITYVQSNYNNNNNLFCDKIILLLLKCLKKKITIVKINRRT